MELEVGLERSQQLLAYHLAGERLQRPGLCAQLTQALVKGQASGRGSLGAITRFGGRGELETNVSWKEESRGTYKWEEFQSER